MLKKINFNRDKKTGMYLSKNYFFFSYLLTLHEAVKLGSVALVKRLLVSKVFNVDQEDAKGFTFLLFFFFVLFFVLF